MLLSVVGPSLNPRARMQPLAASAALRELAGRAGIAAMV